MRTNPMRNFHELCGFDMFSTVSVPAFFFTFLQTSAICLSQERTDIKSFEIFPQLCTLIPPNPITINPQQEESCCARLFA